MGGFPDSGPGARPVYFATPEEVTAKSLDQILRKGAQLPSSSGAPQARTVYVDGPFGYKQIRRGAS